MTMNSNRTYLAMPEAFREFMEAFSEKLAEMHKKTTSHYVSHSNVYRLRHGSSWDTQTKDQNDASSFEAVVSHFSLDPSDVAKNELKTLINAIEETAAEMHKSFAERMYSVIGKAAESVGNTISAQEHESIIDAVYASLEKIDFFCDRFGNVTLPTMHVSPETGKLLQEAESKSSPEINEKFEKLIAAKTKEAIDAEAARKKKFIRYGENNEAAFIDRM